MAIIHHLQIEGEGIILPDNGKDFSRFREDALIWFAEQRIPVPTIMANLIVHFGAARFPRTQKWVLHFPSEEHAVMFKLKWSA
jgi:hypothetical protein